MALNVILYTEERRRKPRERERERERNSFLFQKLVFLCSVSMNGSLANISRGSKVKNSH